LIAADDSLDDAELARVIFEPGFSTSSEVNDISGRGVGMNAVKEYVEQENGQVRLQLLAQQRGGCHPFVFEVDLGDNLYITVPKAA
jgi:chemotaxis protein histidine kinase CheA